MPFVVINSLFLRSRQGQQRSAEVYSACPPKLETSLGQSLNADSEMIRDVDDALSSTDAESQHSSSSKGRFVNPRLISDATIGLSDGLTVPFALTAGLSALGDTRTVIFGGLAELIAGAISMGLGGYLGAKSEVFVHSIPLKTVIIAPPPLFFLY